ncbi:hypothetical protein BJY52DRAFT_657290 [Lactarius psammicola]|nr:hypothetical protein BJY52DRAFT_657290 [Lactarius psammicola]
MADLLGSPLVATTSSLVTPWMCSVRLAEVVPLLCDIIVHPAIYLHMDTCQKRVATDVRVFSVILSRVARVGLPFNGAHIIMLLHVFQSGSVWFLFGRLSLEKRPPPHEANRKVLPDARKSCSLSPKIPFGLARVVIPGVASPRVADQDD